VRRCERQFGFIEDKSANRNINICGDDAHKQPTLYVSKSNQVDIVLNATRQAAGNLLLSVKGPSIHSIKSRLVIGSKYVTVAKALRESDVDKINC